ncbi:expressed unknown protein [Ectocarpus siliculosus]|uniref:Uncharacterized protein n=1 Tax=Ectocarpus siliculosus TaxID=2880 RepID=D7FY44_ECTSI|nr:expressed unknown protein [Ectocarpus siliculosus]|eukprot:CBJ32457.1 expressed unknown protein [Ectocarpus siliculosus]
MALIGKSLCQASLGRGKTRQDAARRGALLSPRSLYQTTLGCCTLKNFCIAKKQPGCHYQLRVPTLPGVSTSKNSARAQHDPFPMTGVSFWCTDEEGGNTSPADCTAEAGPLPPINSREERRRFHESSRFSRLLNPRLICRRRSYSVQ